jgi:hypothetical protein
VLASSKIQSDSSALPVDLRVVVAISICLSLWLILIDPIINRDAILYLRTAEAYLQDGILASFALFDRPFLSIIMGLLHKLTGLSLLHCGLIFSTVFYAMLSATFVSIVRLIGGDRRVQIIAAIVILSHPMIASGRDSIMRGPPFWAFSLLAFRSLLLYVRQPGLKHQVYWFIFIACATLFRFEGVFFALLAPLAAYSAMEKTERLKLSVRLLILPVLATAIVGISVLPLQTVWLPGSQLFPDIGDYLKKLLALPRVFNEVSISTGKALLVFTSRSDANLAVFAGLAAVLLVNIVRAIMWPYVVVLVLGRAQKLYREIPLHAQTLLNFHLLIALIYLALFTLTNRFMLERYCHIFTIFIALYLPFILKAGLAVERKPFTKFLATLLLVSLTIDVVSSATNNKGFIKDASQWISANTAENASIVSNVKYIGYFANRETDWDNLGAFSFKAAELANRPALWRSSDYIVVRVRLEEFDRWLSFLDKNSLDELISFDGDSHGKISIIKVPAHLKTKGGSRSESSQH